MSETGLVTAVGARSCRVHLPGRGEVRCTLRGLLFDDESEAAHPVAAGDHVSVVLEGDEGVIESVAPRSNYLARPVGSSGRRSKTQVIAANIDRLVVVAALDDPPFRPGLVDRFLVAAAMQDIHPVLVLNKVDLERPPGDASAGGPRRDVVGPYREFGIEVLETSGRTGEGIAALGAVLHSGISLLVGHSGVGKSSLLNAVSPGLELSIGAVTAYHGRGRHTTTNRELVPLPGGALLLDTPGMRELALWADESVLDSTFAEIIDLAGACRFADCTHLHEPGCAVQAAIADGSLEAERFDSYLKLQRELRALEVRKDARLRSE
ncbi:MAG TPA: ribosome small subunit-dependent GTPase A, partial [Planctomycetota bacterium]|nr:ribosome small subunit-dependent GTPase A [Planctomycetota bacterium]